MMILTPTEGESQMLRLPAIVKTEAQRQKTRQEAQPVEGKAFHVRPRFVAKSGDGRAKNARGDTRGFSHTSVLLSGGLAA